MCGSNTTAPLCTRYQVSNSTFGTHSRNKSSGTVVAYNGLHGHLIWTHWTFFCGDTSNSECMQLLHQHCRNFETVLRMLVPPAMLYNVQREVQSRVQMCIVAEGHHFEHDR
ncbi:hypothetical protein AVEN_89849-1 [Araneus ventricosus]|uniref:Uncharacterized protein n=1 Tax=Araneus ventricosus TaxID=182803 RepID=A0A4Y2IBQ5_ARAVE|nr:hypothetical protein AVEN_89849-1 [Araneus ventricosus]